MVLRPHKAAENAITSIGFTANTAVHIQFDVHSSKAHCIQALNPVVVCKQLPFLAELL